NIHKIEVGLRFRARKLGDGWYRRQQHALFRSLLEDERDVIVLNPTVPRRANNRHVGGRPAIHLAPFQSQVGVAAGLKTGNVLYFYIENPFDQIGKNEADTARPRLTESWRRFRCTYGGNALVLGV